MTIARSAFWSLGFRPFFLAAGIWAMLALAIWLLRLLGWMPGDLYYGGTLWHAHEMLFGYAVAVMSGFLLTATRNWTGMPTASGAALGGLVALWIAGRAAPSLGLPAGLAALLDLAFLPALAISMFKPLWHGPNPANRVFLALIAGMTLASLLTHLGASGLGTAGLGRTGDRLMLDLILLTLLVVAGRVMPFFTRSAFADAQPQTRTWVERSAFALAVLFLATDVWLPGTLGASACALALAAAQAVRLIGWHDRRVWRLPILAVLYWGYLWLILGLVLTGLAHLGKIPPFPALHALTAGAVGIFTLGMMVRVTLGHTGRAMVAPPLAVLAFRALYLAVAIRVAGPLLWPGWTTTWWAISGLLWILAFSAFLVVMGPMLIKERADATSQPSQVRPVRT